MSWYFDVWHSNEGKIIVTHSISLGTVILVTEAILLDLSVGTDKPIGTADRYVTFTSNSSYTWNQWYMNL